MLSKPPCIQPDGTDCKDRGTSKCRPYCEKWKLYTIVHNKEKERMKEGYVVPRPWYPSAPKATNLKLHGHRH